MTTNRAMDIMNHIQQRLSQIKTDNGYNSNVKSVDSEYREVSYHEYPFIYINDVKTSYENQICKDLYRKTLEIHILGHVRSENTSNVLAKIGTEIQRLKEDVSKSLHTDTFFNSTDLQIQLLDIMVDDMITPPQGMFLLVVVVQYYEEF